MTETLIREALPEDVPGMVECSTSLFAEDAGARDATMNLDWPKEFAADSMREGIDDPTRAMLAAVREGKVVGHLTGSIAEPTAMRPVRIATLTSMYVRPEARDGGVGAKLVAAFREWAVKRDAQRVKVTAYASNADAIRFYQRVGFEPFHLTLEAELPDMN